MLNFRPFLPMLIKQACLIFLTLGLISCASVPSNLSSSKKDPWEQTNRVVFTFNDNLDEYLIRPISEVYQSVVPNVIRTGVRNVFSNVGDVYTAVNNLLQGKPKWALDDMIRVLVNTTIGLGGIFDVASDAGLEKHSEDFGQTLGRWKIPSGPYVVLPVLGSSTVRDALGNIVDIKADIFVRNIENIPLRNSLTGLRIVDQRSRYLGTTELIEAAAFDKYSFVRDAHLQRRRNKLNDGNPPMMDEDEDEISVLPNESSSGISFKNKTIR